MKKTAFLTLVVLVSSCASLKPFDLAGFIDYSRYSERGVFLTESNSVSFYYDPIGSINVIVKSGYNKVQEDDKNRFDDIYFESGGKWNYQAATIEHAFDVAVSKALEQNANGIINIKYEYLSDLDSWFVSGMAVKIKDRD